jgi:hypothetical protein
MITMRENNLFDFIVFPGGYFDLPFQYASHLQDTQYAALQSTKVGDLLLGYGNQFLEKSTYKTVNFITNLTQQIHSDFNPESRLEGEPFQPDKTFYRKKGSCRDLSWI